MTDKRLKDILNQQLTVFFGQMSRHFDKRFDERFNKLEKSTTANFDRIYITLDGIAKRLETDDQERVAMSSQLDRHENWISQLADATNTKLAPEQ